MMRTEDDKRPSPEALLVVAEQERRGRLKVFLGAAPGVGKTFSMLEAAQAKKREGVDVVIGIVETHGRAETRALLEGLEIIPRRKIQYRGRLLEEMDLDAILARTPQLVLVDELAHTNIDGSRHPKRYLDVEELLAAGIDVYTTINIQHLESLNDVIAQITGVRVRETLPDRLLERANEIELIDVSPETLLQRLREGKVYVPDQAERAIRHYFRPGNLTALRELALRRTAQRVDDQMRDYMRAHSIPGPWPAQDRIMVCVSESVFSPRLVRAAKRRADRRRVEWLAVYIETPRHYRLSEHERDRIAKTLRLAEQLGGEAVTIGGQNVAEDLIRYAQSRNVTEFIIGKSLHSRWHEIFRGSVVHDLIRKSGDIDVYVISGEEKDETPPRRLTPASTPARQFNAYFSSILAVVLAAILIWVVEPLDTLPNRSMIFLTAILFSAVTWGLGPSILASILSVLIYDFFFVHPVLTLTVASPQDLLALTTYLGVAVLTSNLAGRAREQARAAQQREARTNVLYGLSRALAEATDMDQAVRAVAIQVSEALGAQAAVFLPDPDKDNLTLRASEPTGALLTEAERAAAIWAWQHNQPTGRGSDTLPGVAWFFLPLRTAQNTVGVLGIQTPTPRSLMPEQYRLLETLGGQAAVTVERLRLAMDMEQARLLTESERLRTALLSSISHDLRTPLASITGAASSLLADTPLYDENEQRDLLLTIQEEAERLNRFVSNLLDMTRLESGVLTLNRDWVEVDDIIGTALARPSQGLRQHRLVVETEPHLPLLHIDFVLMGQVLINLLDNAAKYSPPGKTIRVAAYRQNETVVMTVSDEGPGISPSNLDHIFEKFYRVQAGDRQSAGAGLGLSICKGIVEAHGGWIAVNNNPTGGAIFSIFLPLEREQPKLTPKETGHE